jgi:chemotaxis protein methyltransferase CheR
MRLVSLGFDTRWKSMQATELTDDEFKRFSGLIYRTAGIRIADTKRVLVANRVRRRLRATGIATYSEYYTYLTSSSGAGEMPHFLDAITTNETYFYRDKHHYAWLEETFLPEITQRAARHKRSRSLRIWSAACATGEEPYSIALRVMARRHLLSGWRISLVGTDLSGSVLETARAGAYDERAIHLTTPEERKRFFDEDKTGRRWIIKEEVRSLVTWKLHNLLTPLREDPFDCIFLKNVLIYFDTASKETVVRNVLAALAKGGYLVIGPTEGIYGMLSPLAKIKPWLYQRLP